MLTIFKLIITKPVYEVIYGTRREGLENILKTMSDGRPGIEGTVIKMQIGLFANDIVQILNQETTILMDKINPTIDLEIAKPVIELIPEPVAVEPVVKKSLEDEDEDYT